MAQTKYQYDNGAKQGSTAWEGTYGSSGGSSYGKEIGYGAPSYLRINNNGKVTDTRNFTFPAGSNRGLGGGGYDVGYDINALKAQWDSWLNEMNSYYKTLYDQQLKNTRTQFEKTRDPINLNFKRNEKAIRSMLGPDSGRGVGMLSGNNNNWANRIADARNWLGNQNSQTLADYQKNIADVKKVYAEKMASLM